MFWAIHKNTGAEVSVLQVGETKDSIRREEIFIARQEDILENESQEEVQVKFRLGTVYELGEKQFERRSCFYIQDKTKKGIKTVSESKDHKAIKEFIWNAIKKRDINLIDANKEKLIFDFDLKSVKLEERKFNGSKLIRGDVTVNFKEEDPNYGKGIIFEIQLSHQYDYIEDQRTVARALSGYSTVWVKIREVIDIKNESLKESCPDLLVKSHLLVLSEIKPKLIEDIKHTSEFYIGIIEHKIREEIKKQIFLKCPKCGDYLIKKKGKYGKFLGCNSYPQCKYILKKEIE